MALLITPDGAETVVSAMGATFTLKELYSILNCSMVQVIYLTDGRYMWLDEEGKFKPHRANLLATRLLHQAGGMATDYIAGSALVTDRNEVD